MVIHPNFPGMQAEIVVNDEALTEYRDDEEPTQANTVARYVEAVSGAYFAFHYIVPLSCHPDYDIQARLIIDGEEVRSHSMRKKATGLRDTDAMIGTSTSHLQGQNMMRRFRFTQLEIGGIYRGCSTVVKNGVTLMTF